ncbi:MAG: cytochrome b/b6 domain-containing protein, partial [Limisphaerales bacterium]
MKKKLRTRVSALFVLTLLLGCGAKIVAAEISNADCLQCHEDKTLTATNKAGIVRSVFCDVSKLNASAHKTNSCVSCHSDVTDKHPDDNLAVKLVDCARCHQTQSDYYAASIHGLAAKKGATNAPTCVNCHGNHGVITAALPNSPLNFEHITQTCGQCHKEPATDVAISVHGQGSSHGKREAATCTDCHAEHKIEVLKARSPLDISRMVCSKCHASERINTKFRMPSDRVKTFFESYHGLAATYGSAVAADCSSCHGFHKILPSSDPRSTINKDHLVQTCGKCHPGANERFALSKVHVDVASSQAGSGFGEKVNWWIRKIYLALIIGVIGAMVAHNGLLMGRKVAARRHVNGASVVRMDVSQRIQHAILAISFIVLAWTGFALKFPDNWWAHALGTEAVRSWTHRIAGIIMLAGGVYHLGYITGSREGRRLVKDMLPAMKDARDISEQAQYLLGMSPLKPRFGRFSYIEKMEYWAVVWGTIIMGATGFMIWFKMDVTRFLQRWCVDAATTVHFYEAILACLAILVWHLYSVIFDPDIYPYSRAAVTGKVPQELYEEEHPLDEA